MNRTPTLAVFGTHPVQYHAPLWRVLAQRGTVGVHVLYGTDMSVRGYKDEGFGVAFQWDTPLLDGYPSEFFSTDPAIQRVNFSQPRAPGAVARLRACKADAVLLTAYNARFFIDAFLAARRLGLPVLLRHEASDVAFERRGPKGVLRDLVLRVVYAQVAGFGVIGTEARRHLLRLGVPASRMEPAPYCVDTSFVLPERDRWLPQRASVRAAWDIPADACVFVFSGKLIPKKNPVLLLQALAALPAATAARVRLVVAGDGEQRAELEQRVRDTGWADRVRFLGFLNQREIGRAYAAADALVLPSRRGAGETWGLVVNEAMHYGCAAIVSDGVGCHPDLIDDGVTGSVFPSGDADALRRCLETWIARLPAQREAVAQAVGARIAGYTLETSAAGLERLVQRTIATT